MKTLNRQERFAELLEEYVGNNPAEKLTKPAQFIARYRSWLDNLPYGEDIRFAKDSAGYEDSAAAMVAPYGQRFECEWVIKIARLFVDKWGEAYGEIPDG